jgi:phenylacetate-CoA ligase
MNTARKLSRLAEVYATQWLRPEQLTSLQERRLQRILRVAADVPLYRERYRKASVSAAEVRGLADLARLPIITREDAASAWPDSILSRPQREGDVIFRTSGTSGMFMQIAYDAAANDFLDAVYGRVLFSAGYDISAEP